MSEYGGDRCRDRLGPHVAMPHAGRLDARRRAKLPVPKPGFLLEPEVGALPLHRGHRDGQQVIQPRADLVVDFRAHHHEADPFDSGKALLVHPQAAQPFAARALEVAQVVGIVAAPADGRVFIVGPHLELERIQGLSGSAWLSRSWAPAGAVMPKWR